MILEKKSKWVVQSENMSSVTLLFKYYLFPVKALLRPSDSFLLWLLALPFTSL